jgi:hypothetical protein
MPPGSIEEIVTSMAVVDPRLDYYAVTLTVDLRGHCVIDTQSEFVGWGDIDRRTEIRAPSLVKPEWMIDYWKLEEQPYYVVKDEREWLLYSQLGGNALVEGEIAESRLSNMFRTRQYEPSTRVTHNFSMFVSLKSLPAHAKQHAPTAKLRMEVLKRDNRRCCFCGSSPSSNVHVELHVHHIRPWAKGVILTSRI